MAENTPEKQKTHILRDLLSDDFTFTKRQIGLILLLVGIIGFVGILSIDVIRGDFSGIGPGQALGLTGMFACFVLGATLIPLGDEPI